MFNGIWLVATEPLTIQGRDIKAGEQFHLSRVHSGALLVTGKAKIVHPQPPPKSQMPAPEPVAAPPKRRRARQRKVLEAEQPSAPAQPDEPEPPDVVEAAETTEPVEPTEASDAETISGSRQRYMRRDIRAEE
jgi:hypothetical protein